MKRELILAELFAAVTLAACGGGDSAEAETSVAPAPLAAIAEDGRKRALYVPAGVDSLFGASVAMNFAEVQFPDLFPRGPVTTSVGSWYYRYYPTTGTYLAIINWRAYVMGGPLGTAVRDMGEITDYVSVGSPPSPSPPPPPLPPTNKAPTVNLTGPAGGSSYQSGSPILLVATATDTDGSVAKVEFYAGTTLLASDAVAPYTHSWTPTGLDQHNVTAVATDNEGARTTSTMVTITVTPKTSPPGTITAAQLSKCPDASGAQDRGFHTCMVGSLAGTQIFDPSKSCNLEIAASGLITITSNGTSYSTSANSNPVPVYYYKGTYHMRVTVGRSTTSPFVGIELETDTDGGLGFFTKGGWLEAKVSTPTALFTCRLPVPAI